MKIEFLESTPLTKLYPPVPAKRLIPDWYKEIEIEMAAVQKVGFGTNLSVKRCIPVLDYMTTGYIIRSHMDIVVKRDWNDTVGENVNFDFRMAEGVPPVVFHDSKQMPVMRNGYLKKIAKFSGMWGVKTPPGYSCLFFQPQYFNETRFTVFPGVVDTDEYTSPIGFPFMMSDSKETETYIIEAGTPLVCVVPFKREEWTHEIKNWDKNDKSAILMRTIWQETYRKFMHTKKSFD